VCGEQESAYDGRLAEGTYATTVSIHNPHDFTTIFSKKLALTYPPGGQLAGDILPIGTDKLDADGSLQTDCADLKERLFPKGFPTPHIEGLVIIDSPASLDVNAVYTSRQGGRNSSPDASSIDVEQVSEREMK
jgi:hypothetical protein